MGMVLHEQASKEKIQDRGVINEEDSLYANRISILYIMGDVLSLIENSIKQKFTKAYKARNTKKN